MSLNDRERQQKFSVLEITMILHYHCTPERYSLHHEAHAHSPAARAAHRKLTALGVLKWNHPTEAGERGYYETTERGKVYVEKLKSIDLPEAKWSYDG